MTLRALIGRLIIKEEEPQTPSGLFLVQEPAASQTGTVESAGPNSKYKVGATVLYSQYGDEGRIHERLGDGRLSVPEWSIYVEMV